MTRINPYLDSERPVTFSETRSSQNAGMRAIEKRKDLTLENLDKATLNNASDALPGEAPKRIDIINNFREMFGDEFKIAIPYIGLRGVPYQFGGPDLVLGKDLAAFFKQEWNYCSFVSKFDDTNIDQKQSNFFNNSLRVKVEKETDLGLVNSVDLKEGGKKNILDSSMHEGNGYPFPGRSVKDDDKKVETLKLSTSSSVPGSDIKTKTVIARDGVLGGMESFSAIETSKFDKIAKEFNIIPNVILDGHRHFVIESHVIKG